MEHHGWEYALDAFVRVCSTFAWPITILLLVNTFHQQVGGVIAAITSVIQRISKVTRSPHQNDRRISSD